MISRFSNYCYLAIFILTAHIVDANQAYIWPTEIQYKFYPKFIAQVARPLQHVHPLSADAGIRNMNPIKLKGYTELQCYTETQFGRFKPLLQSTNVNLGPGITGKHRIRAVILLLTSGDIWWRTMKANNQGTFDMRFIGGLWGTFQACLNIDSAKKASTCYFSLLEKRNGKVKSMYFWNGKGLVKSDEECEGSVYIPLFLLSLCHNYGMNYPFLCPNLCLGKLNDNNDPVQGDPCSNIEHAVPKTCKQNRNWSEFLTKFFKLWLDWTNLPTQPQLLRDMVAIESGYSCNCKQNYVWSKNDMNCKLGNQDRTCHDPGTLRISNGNCVCAPEYLGKRCEEKKDACLMKLNYLEDAESGDRIPMAGLELCNLNMSGMGMKDEEGRNECVPVYGTNKYSCRCKGLFMPKISIPLQNCLYKSTPCDAKLCLHGVCMTQHSDKAEHWSPWSDCSPLCGKNRQRFRKRKQHVTLAELKEDAEPIREIIQKESCPPRSNTICEYIYREEYRRSVSSPDAPWYELEAMIFTTFTFGLWLIMCLIALLRCYM